MKQSVEELEHRLADLRARLPRHSTPAAMLIELEELEEELARRRAAEDCSAAAGNGQKQSRA